METQEIYEILAVAGCDVRIVGERVYVHKTPNGKRAQYGYCVPGDDIRDITANIVKRGGEIAALLRR